MHGQLSQDTVVAAAASAVWDVYRGLELGRLVNQLLPDVLGKVEVIEGDGSVGTPGTGYMKEIFTKIDEEKRVKEAETIEGGFKALGFNVYRARFEIIEKDSATSVIRSTIEYEVDDELANLASHVTTKQVEILAEAIGKHLCEKKATG
ncbi:hypothetical protein Pint_21018 [Pistacia integerrima]|uniref:Uncharacterized protein n=1 Tax=Pistacia integerrima TaxID=434235 RepID=A0ACC0XBG9_9ROSI|nr:hypothetical protein Pint_21018 [Pistacia integerrima]